MHNRCFDWMFGMRQQECMLSHAFWSTNHPCECHRNDLCLNRMGFSKTTERTEELSFEEGGYDPGNMGLGYSTMKEPPDTIGMKIHRMSGNIN